MPVIVSTRFWYSSSAFAGQLVYTVYEITVTTIDTVCLFRFIALSGMAGARRQRGSYALDVDVAGGVILAHRVFGHAGVVPRILQSRSANLDL